jgi:hypothetical protein
MKHIIEFDPYEDADELEVVINAKKWAGLAQEFRGYLRGVRKYGDRGEEVADILDELWDKLHELAGARGLDL